TRLYSPVLHLSVEGTSRWASTDRWRTGEDLTSKRGSAGPASDTPPCPVPWPARAVWASGPCGSAAAAISRHCATLLDRQLRQAVGLVHPRPTMHFDSAPTSRWPEPAAQWSCGPTLLRSLLFGVDRGRSTPSLWCVPTW